MKNYEKLRKLAGFLKTVPAEQFDMEWWAVCPEGTHYLNVGQCGTSACAFGWCPTLWPKELTLVGYTDPYNNALTRTAVAMRGDPLPKPGEFVPVFHTAAKFFGITLSDATFLFDPDDYEGEDEDEHVSLESVVDRLLLVAAKYERLSK